MSNIDDLNKAYFPVVDLNVRELIDNCCDDKQVFTKNMVSIKDNYNRKIHGLTSYLPYGLNHFMNSLRLCGNKDTLIGPIKLNSNDLIKKMCIMLNVSTNKTMNINDPAIDQLILDRIEVLKGIKTYNDLGLEFPELRAEYLAGRHILDDYNNINSLDLNDPLQAEIYNRNIARKANYPKYGFRKDIVKFVEERVKYFESLLRHKNDIKKYCDRSYIDSIFFEGINKDKLLLYVVNKYIEKIESLDNDEDIISLLDVIKTRLDDIRKISDLIYIDEDNKINNIYLLAKYFELRRKVSLPKSIKVGGAILPSSNDPTRVHNNVERKYKPLTDEERQELIKANLRKRKFYEESEYLTVLNENIEYTGNCAFVYPNGHILEDYIADECDDMSLKKTKKNAIYHVDIYGFDDLLGMGKKEVKNDSRCHGTFNHSGDWESRARKVVELPATATSLADTKKFIKRLSEKEKSL